MTKSEIIYKDFVSRYKLNSPSHKLVLEEALSEFLHKFHGIKIERAGAAYEGRNYPDLIILDRTRNIFGYLCVQHYNKDKFSQKEKVELDALYKKRIKAYYSEVDRPIFFLNWFSSVNGEGIYYQTSEQIQDILLKTMDENNSELFFPKKEEMGDFEELIKTIKSNL